MVVLALSSTRAGSSRWRLLVSQMPMPALADSCEKVLVVRPSEDLLLEELNRE